MGCGFALTTWCSQNLARSAPTVHSVLLARSEVLVLTYVLAPPKLAQRYRRSRPTCQRWGLRGKTLNPPYRRNTPGSSYSEALDGRSPSTMDCTADAENCVPRLDMWPISANSWLILRNERRLPFRGRCATQPLGLEHRFGMRLSVRPTALAFPRLAALALTSATQLCDGHGLVEFGCGAQNLADKPVVGEGAR